MSKHDKNFSELLRRQFLGTSKVHTQNLKSLSAYFGTDGATIYDGSFFDFYEKESSNNNLITASDLVAVTFLSMEIRRKSRSGISTANAIGIESRSHEIEQILTQIPTDLELHKLTSAQFSQLVGEGSYGDKLWRVLRDKEKGLGMHRVATFKLIARKRPNLYPIRDSRTQEVLGKPSRWWSAWYEALVNDSDLVNELVGLRQEVGQQIPKINDVSLLRIADIALWNKGHK